MLGDTAEASDVVQDIFLKIFRNINGFKGEAALKTWIFRIAFSEDFEPSAMVETPPAFRDDVARRSG
jgi:hypothetical protein